MNTQLGFGNILVAIDFSPPAEAAFHQALWVASHTGTPITLAHALPAIRLNPSEAMQNMDLSLDLLVKENLIPESLELDMIREAYSKLSRMAERFEESTGIRTKVFLGDPHVAVVKSVQAEAHDLVVAGTRGLARWEQFLVGSTAKRLIKNGPSTVWIVKAEHTRNPRVILATTDFSDVSRKAVMYGHWIAQLSDAEFHLLHVVDSHDVPPDIISKIPAGISFQ